MRQVKKKTEEKVKHKMFVPIKDKERWNLVAMLIKNYPGQASMTGGAMVETDLDDLAGLFAQWNGSVVILTPAQVVVVAEEATEPPQLVEILEPARIKKAWQPDTQEAGKKECRGCYQLKWVNEDGLCKWCVKRLARAASDLKEKATAGDQTVKLVATAPKDQIAAGAVIGGGETATEVATTSDDAGDAGPAEQPKCIRCGRTGKKITSSGMCRSCNIKTAQNSAENKLQSSDRRAGGGMQVLAQGMHRGSGQALKGRKLG